MIDTVTDVLARLIRRLLDEPALLVAVAGVLGAYGLISQTEADAWLALIGALPALLRPMVTPERRAREREQAARATARLSGGMGPSTD